MLKRWICWIGVAVCWLGALQTAPAEERQRSFTSADEAASALVTALREHNEADWRAILGPESDHVIDLKGPHADQQQLQDFLALYDEKHSIDRKVPGRAELNIGPDDWPLPIPIIESNGRWTFDTSVGAQSIVDRRIGRNELSAIHTLLTCVKAQHDYFDTEKRTNGTGVYATRLVSTPGRHDGLYWLEGEAESQLRALIDAARDPGDPDELAGGKAIPEGGYYFRILKAQGPNGDGGAKSYIQVGHMTGGFALIAWPAPFDARADTVMASLTLLAPDIVEAILDGRQPEGLGLATLLKPFPLEWDQQRYRWAITGARNGSRWTVIQRADNVQVGCVASGLSRFGTAI